MPESSPRRLDRGQKFEQVRSASTCFEAPLENVDAVSQRTGDFLESHQGLKDAALDALSNGMLRLCQRWLDLGQKFDQVRDDDGTGAESTIR